MTSGHPGRGHCRKVIVDANDSSDRGNAFGVRFHHCCHNEWGTLPDRGSTSQARKSRDSSRHAFEQGARS